MVFDITWIMEAFEEIEEPTLQDRLIALGFLSAEVEAEFREGLKG